MRNPAFSGVLIISLALGACAPSKAVVRTPRPPAPRKSAPAAQPRPTQADQKAIDQLYYQAVAAYTRNDLAAANLYLGEILKLDPAYPPARELIEKLLLAVPKR